VDDEFLTSDAQLVLLKFVDGMVHMAGNIESCLVEGCAPIMQELVKISVPRLLNMPESFGEGPIECMTSSTRLLLDVFQTTFTTPRPLEPEANRYADFAEILICISL
jgi:hypothetical protein